MTAEEKAAYHRSYYARNREKISERRKQRSKETYARQKPAIEAAKAADPERFRTYWRNHKRKNPEKARSVQSEYYQRNRETILVKGQDRYHETLEYQRERKKLYNNLPRTRFFEGIRRELKYETDVNYRLASVLRSRLWSALRNGQKGGSAVSDLGCSIPEFRTYIETKFLPGMSWDNWALDTWHLDHIKPLAAFDLADRAQFLEACHYTNFQPLWALDNIRKGARLT